MQTIQSTFPNLYLPLNFLRIGQPIASVFSGYRKMQLPKFEIWQLDQDKIGSATIASPPPFRNGSFRNEDSLFLHFYENHSSDVLKHKIYPTPKGKMGVHVNMIYDQDITCKSVSYEVVTRYDAVAGIKRKRADATGTDDESGGKNDTD